MRKHTFDAKLIRPEGIGTWTYLLLPFDAAAAFGTTGQARVKGTVNDHAFRSTALPQGDGRHYVVINKTIRNAIGAEAPDKVHVVIEADTTKRVVVVPKDLSSALAKSARANKEFKGFPYSHQKEIVDWICDAKRDETRKRRIVLAIEKLAAGTA